MVIANASALLEAGRGFLRRGDERRRCRTRSSAVEHTDSSALASFSAWLRTAQRGA